MVGPGGHERVPKRLAMVARHVDLVTELADEAHPHQERRDAGDVALAHPHVGEGLGPEVDILAGLGQHLARLGTGDVDGGVARRDVGDVDLEPPLGVVPQHVAIDPVDARGGGGDVEVLLVEAGGDAVVDHHAGTVGHQHVARPPQRLLGVGEGVDALEELGGIGAPHLEAAERRDVDQADVAAHVEDLLDDGRGAALRGAVVLGPQPRPGHHHLGAQLGVAMVHRGAAHRLEDAARQEAELLGPERRPRGGGADESHALALGPGIEARRGQRRVTALARAHADGGVALHQLDVVVALGDGVEDVLDLQVLVEVDEIAALGMGEHGPGVISPAGAGGRRRGWPLAPLEAGVARRQPALEAAVGDHRLERVVAVDRAGGEEPGREALEGEGGGRVVVAQPGAGVEQEIGHRAVAGGGHDQITGHLAYRWAADPLGIDRRDPRPLDGFEPGPGQRLPHRAAGQHLGAAPPRLVAQGAGLGLGPEVGDRGHLDAGVEQIEGRAVAVAAGRRDHRAGARLDPMVPHQALRARGQQDPRQVVVAEHHRLLVGARGHHHRLGPDLEKPVAAGEREPVVGEQAAAQGAGHDLERRSSAGRRLELGQHPIAALKIEIEAGKPERAAKRRLLLDDEHLGAGRRRGGGGGEPRRTAAHHHHVGEQIGLVVIAVPAPELDVAEPGEAADQALPQLPRPTRPIERLVVKARGQEAPQAVEDLGGVALQGADIVLRRHLEPRLERRQVGEHVGLVADAHQGVGLLAGARHHPPRPVVLEGARQHPHAPGPQRARHAIAGEPRIGPSLEAEGERALPVHEPAEGRAEALGGALLARRHGPNTSLAG